jgi:hypothetical protein
MREPCPVKVPSRLQLVVAAKQRPAAVQHRPPFSLEPPQLPERDPDAVEATAYVCPSEQQRPVESADQARRSQLPPGQPQSRHAGTAEGSDKRSIGCARSLGHDHDPRHTAHHGGAS